MRRSPRALVESRQGVCPLSPRLPGSAEDHPLPAIRQRHRESSTCDPRPPGLAIAEKEAPPSPCPPPERPDPPLLRVSRAGAENGIPARSARRGSVDRPRTWNRLGGIRRSIVGPRSAQPPLVPDPPAPADQAPRATSPLGADVWRSPTTTLPHPSACESAQSAGVTFPKSLFEEGRRLLSPSSEAVYPKHRRGNLLCGKGYRATTTKAGGEGIDISPQGPSGCGGSGTSRFVIDLFSLAIVGRSSTNNGLRTFWILCRAKRR